MIEVTDKALIFDMDGVLVDVTGSYREAILATVEHFTGGRLSHEEIQAMKNRGGFNNDWELSWNLARQNGVEVPYPEVVEVFQRLYRGRNNDGLLLNERWLPLDGVLERLAGRYRLAIFTGRLHEEAEFALHRFAPALRFEPVVGMDDVERQKPDPEGLKKICAALGAGSPTDLLYVGDSIDDCRAAAATQVGFIGVAAQAMPYREELASRFLREGARVVISDVNALEEALQMRNAECGVRNKEP